MFCKKCGANIPDNSAVCPYCGDITAMSAQHQTIVVQNDVSADKNGMAIAGFVLGLIGFLSFGTSFIFEILGLIFSIVGICKAKGANDNGKGLAIAGLILSVASFVMAILFYAWLLELIKEIISSMSMAFIG